MQKVIAGMTEKAINIMERMEKKKNIKLQAQKNVKKLYSIRK